MAKTEDVTEKKTRIGMPEQEPDERRRNFEEVPLGYSPEMAMKEASRCLQCKSPTCIEGCPVEIDIPAFVKLIKEEKFDEAIKKIWEKNRLPAVCGRVCPQETQCEGRCVLGKKGRPIAIGNLERFAADFARQEGIEDGSLQAKPSGKRVAIVGSGPAGLTVAADLIAKGHQVTIFEALHKPGGVLVYGIPEFRLPKDIVADEVRNLEKQGAEIRCNTVVGRTVTIDELFKEGYDAIFVGVGAGLPRFMNIPGENLVGILSANEYLTRANLMKAYQFPEYDTPIPKGKNVVVIGAGNVAMDSARTAMRLGAETVRIVYRRSRDEMPARAAEIHHAEEEGIEFFLLTNPTRFIGDEEGRVVGMECIRMELGEPDGSGRRSPVPIEGSEFEISCDLVIIAIGTGANPLLTRSTEGLKLNRWGYIEADPETGKTSIEGVWAGGDIVTGSATVIEAMGAGRRAARSIHEYLTKSA
ncbi:MAG TPA: NADPH-dependent glutamate synthase [Methanothrix sp.]|nr:NADPH-dependent glutamate synthase [Methanothrix sp.]HPR65662.1 NADPH-dependent glutamate synthase [Methanothrix sp.]